MSMSWGKLQTSTLDSLVSLLGLASPFACGALWQLGCDVWQSWISLSLPLSFFAIANLPLCSISAQCVCPPRCVLQLVSE